MEFARLLAERPRRIVEVLKLPEVGVIITKNCRCVLSVFHGLPVLIHPSGAHLRLGGNRELFHAFLPGLIANGFDGDIKLAIKRSSNIQKTLRTFWDSTHVDNQEALCSAVPAYDDSEEAKLLASPMIYGPSSNQIGGQYWRADLLGHILATMAGSNVEGYYGSYEEVLLREVSIVSPLFGVLGVTFLHNKDTVLVQKFYEEQITGRRLSLDYQVVTDSVYPANERLLCYVSELTEQKKPRKQDKVREIIKEEVPVAASEEIAVPVRPSADVSHARFVMEGLGLKTVATRTSASKAIFSIALLCGSVVIIDPSGIYVKLFVSPNTYEVNLADMRSAGLDESPAFIAFLTSGQATVTARRWWEELKDDKKERITQHFASLPVDQGLPKEKRQGGYGYEWMVGMYWRADLLPYILWGASGSRIPRYRGSREEIFLNQQRLKQPLCSILEVTTHLSIAEIRGRARIGKDKSSLTEAAEIAALAAVANSAPLAAGSAAAPSVAGTVKATLKERHYQQFQSYYVTREVANPPPVSDRMARNYPKGLVDAAWVSAETLLPLRYAEGVASAQKTIEDLQKQLDYQRDREAELRRLLGERIRTAVPQVAGVIGEDAAEPLINAAFGEYFGLLKRNCGERMKSADFIHDSLSYGFMLHEVKNGETTISTADGVDKLLRDVEECEKESKMPCFAAVMYSFRSAIANNRDFPIMSFMAPNGHTLIVCVNNIQQQVEWSAGHVSELDIFCDATARVLLHVKSRLEMIFALAEDLDLTEQARIVNRVLGITTEKSEVANLLARSEDAEDFIESVMKPLETQRSPRGRQPKRAGGLRRASSIRSASVRSLRWHQSTTTTVAAVRPEVQDDRAAGQLEVVRDGATGLRVIEATDEAGTTSRTVFIDGRAQELTEEVDLPTFIPLAWQGIFNVSKPWGPAKRRTSETLMDLCRLDPGQRVRRSELAGKIATVTGSSVATVRDLLTFILDEVHNGHHWLKGVSWKIE